MLGLLVNTLTADDKYSLLKKDNFNTLALKLSLLRRKILIVFVIFEFGLIFGHFQKKMTLIVDEFLELPTPKDVVR